VATFIRGAYPKSNLLAPLSSTEELGPDPFQAAFPTASTGLQLGRRRSCNDLPRSIAPIVPASRQPQHSLRPQADRQHKLRIFSVGEIRALVHSVVAPPTKTFLSFLLTSLAGFSLERPVFVITNIPQELSVFSESTLSSSSSPQAHRAVLVTLQLFRCCNQEKRVF
jgi:hypothetical protein